MKPGKRFTSPFYFLIRRNGKTDLILLLQFFSWIMLVNWGKLKTLWSQLKEQECQLFGIHSWVFLQVGQVILKSHLNSLLTSPDVLWCHRSVSDSVLEMPWKGTVGTGSLGSNICTLQMYTGEKTNISAHFIHKSTLSEEVPLHCQNYTQFYTASWTSRLQFFCKHMWLERNFRFINFIKFILSVLLSLLI